MRKGMKQEVSHRLIRNHRRRVWKRIVNVLACAVVFCTVYALILPAITLEKGPTEAPAEAHQHEAACYTYRRAYTCEQEGNDHVHTEECCTLVQELSCTLAPQDDAQVLSLAQQTPNPAAAAEPAAEPTATDSVLPQGPISKDLEISDGIGLYSVGMDGEGNPTAVAGVTYTVYNPDGSENQTVITNGESLFVDLDINLLQAVTLGEGEKFTIKQTGAPDTYAVAAQEKSFGMPTAGRTSIGVFYLFESAGFDPHKTAEVTDYSSRLYKLNLSAMGGASTSKVTPANFVFVVDSSASMLYPAKLTKVEGATVTLGNKAYLKSIDKPTGNTDALNALNLDKTQVYYFISAPESKAKVFALWYYEAKNAWYCIDSSKYYNKDKTTGEYIALDAQYCVDDLKFETEEFKDSDKEKDIGSATYPLYTAGDPYDRLTYLKEQLAMMAYELTAISPENTITITTFDGLVRRCLTYPSNEVPTINDLVNEIGKISTHSGTAQQRGLGHIVTEEYPVYKTPDADTLSEEDIVCKGGDHLKQDKMNYVFLVTDGAFAPNHADDTDKKEEGNPKLQASRDKLFTNATKIRNFGQTETDKTEHARLYTIGLSVEDVPQAWEVLAEVTGTEINGTTYNGIASEGCAYLDKTADQLGTTIQNVTWKSLNKMEKQNSHANITDYISDSFYLVDPSGAPLSTDDWITAAGSKTTAGAADAVGQVGQDTNGWYVQWANQTLPVNEVGATAWSGSVYVKAKEDFVGGNAIKTNKTATIDVLNVSDPNNVTVDITIPLDSPTVNVKLLTMSQNSTEETVFLGDSVNPDERLQALLDQINFTKVTAGTGDEVCNKVAAGTDNGLTADSFTLGYATNPQPTVEEWNTLLTGVSVEIPYTYDTAEGAVGYFTLQLAKTAGDYAAHNITAAAGLNAEQYTLTVTYTAYGLGQGPADATEEQKRPAAIVGSTNPGTAVTSETSTNTHSIHVVDGKITVTKTIEDSLVKDADQNFTFNLQRLNDETGEYELVTGEPLTLTVAAGEKTSASGIFDGLRRGTYKLVETPNDGYSVKSMTVKETDTNCTTAGSGTKEVTFTIGIDLPATPATDAACKGVSYASVEVVNGLHTKELAVKKTWSTGTTSTTAYVALYRNGEAVMSGGKTFALKLNAENGWTATIEVPVDSQNQAIADAGYSIRELSGVTTTAPAARLRGGQAVVVNDNDVEIHYEEAKDSGLVKVGNTGFLVTTGSDTIDGKYTLTANNAPAPRLPETGGPGTAAYTAGGLLLMAAAVFLLFKQIRRRRDENSAV